VNLPIVMNSNITCFF